MSPPVDPAILRALSLDPSSTKIASHGGSGFASTFRLTTITSSNLPRSIFVKTSPDPDAALMFEGEHTSLNAIHSAVPSLCPQSFAWAKLDSQANAYFLATEFIDLSGSRRTLSQKGSDKTGSGMTLARKLAKLHTTPAPIPDGYSTPQFGFPVPTCCGDTPQPNQPYTTSWCDFFATNRLLFILQRGERRNGKDAELHSLVDRTASEVVPSLLGKGHLGGGCSEGITPVVVHGDIWSGNHSRGTFAGRQPESSPTIDEEEEEDGGQVEARVEDIIYDPSSVYAHSEYELGIMKMFGGFSSAFYREYHDLVPKTEPVAEYDDRVALYESFHHLNHWAIFGAGYRNSAANILKGLVKRYAGDG